MAIHNDFGKEGEQYAVDFLLDKGYVIKSRNYRYLKAEVDVIAEKDGVLAVIEVKSRRSDFIQNIVDTVTKKKIDLLVMAADNYVTTNELDFEVRFDIITVLKNKNKFKLEHIKSAFYHF